MQVLLLFFLGILICLNHHLKQLFSQLAYFEINF